MRKSISADAALRIGRRGFLAGGCAIGLAPVSAIAGVLPVVAAASASVCAVHGDQPYLDTSGLVREYVPPPGARSAEALAELDEATLRAAHPYL